jgi:hypothetical protein
MLYREIVTVLLRSTQNKNTMPVQNVEFVNVKPGGTLNYWALNPCKLEIRSMVIIVGRT